MEQTPWWHAHYSLMHKNDDSLGSAGWLVSPATVKLMVGAVERLAIEKTWKEVIKMIDDHMMISGGRRDIDALRDLREKIEDKLNSL